MEIVIRISSSVNALLILLLRGGTEPGDTAEEVKSGGCMCCRHLRRLGKGKERGSACLLFWESIRASGFDPRYL